MMANNGNYRIRKVHAREDLRADDRVYFHLFKLGGSQWAGLVQDVRRYGEFADVVQQCAGFKSGDIVRLQPKHFAHTGGIDLDTPDVAMGGLIFSVDRGGEGFGGSEVKLA